MNFDRRLGAQHPNAGQNTQHTITNDYIDKEVKARKDSSKNQ
jgi:hypothetical protein